MLKPSILLSVCLLVFLCPPILVGQQAQIAEIANTLATQFSQKGRKVIAVSQFSNDDGFDDRFSRFLGNQLTTQLALASAQTIPPAFKVVDRAKTDTVLKELNNQYKKPFDASTFAKFGTGTGADTIITGDFRVTTNRIAVNCIALNMSMEVVGGKVFDIPRTPEIDEYLGKPSIVSGQAPNVHPGQSNPQAYGTVVSDTSLRTYQNAFLRADVVSIVIKPGAEADRNSSLGKPQLFYVANIGLNLANRLQDDLYLAAFGESKSSATLFDDQSVACEQVGIQGLQTIKDSVMLDYAYNYSTFPAGSQTTIILQFKCISDKPGTVFVLNLGAARLIKEHSYAKFSIGFNNVRAVAK